MISSSVNKRRAVHAILLLALIFIIAAAGGCSCSEKNNDRPVSSAEPSPSADAWAEGSGSPYGSPSASADPSEAAVSDTADPTSASDPDSSEGVYTPAPGETQQPSGSGAPSASQSLAPGQTPSPTQLSSAQPTSPSGHTVTTAPVQPSTPTPIPTATPKPDPVTALTHVAPGNEYYCDMDFDGRNEKIEISRKERDGGDILLTVKITVGKTGSVLVDSFATEHYFDGILNNFNSGDKRVELLISTGVGKREDTIRCYKLDDSSGSLSACAAEGRMISVGANSVTVSRFVDLMGTWECLSDHSFSYSEFALESIDGEWRVKNEPNRWCTVSNPMLVGFYSNGNENEFGYLYPGYDASRICPTATDLKTRIDFITDANVSGYLSVSFSEGVPLFEGKPMDHWFSDLTYIK